MDIHCNLISSSSTERISHNASLTPWQGEGVIVVTLFRRGEWGGSFVLDQEHVPFNDTDRQCLNEAEEWASKQTTCLWETMKGKSPPIRLVHVETHVKMLNLLCSKVHYLNAYFNHYLIKYIIGDILYGIKDKLSISYVSYHVIYIKNTKRLWLNKSILYLPLPKYFWYQYCNRIIWFLIWKV